MMISFSLLSPNAFFFYIDAVFPLRISSSKQCTRPFPILAMHYDIYTLLMKRLKRNYYHFLLKSDFLLICFVVTHVEDPGQTSIYRDLHYER